MSGHFTTPRDLSGKRFDRWTVLRLHGCDRTNRQIWLCRCDCGTVRPVKRCLLVTRNSRSCGCRHGTHRATNTRAFKIWDGMKERCRNPRNISYRYYGGRGVSVCRRWLRFENFLADMGEPPPGHSIDRIDPSKGYRPSNCRWATPRQQARNRSDAKYILYKGQRVHWKEVAERTGINPNTLWFRLFVYKWPIADAVSRPVQTHVR